MRRKSKQQSEPQLQQALPRPQSQRKQQEQQQQTIVATLADIAERLITLVREEIELAKAEVSTKVTKLLKGSVVGFAAGFFALLGIIFLLLGLVYGLYALLPFNDLYISFLIVAVLLFLLAGLAGFLASRAVKAGAPPTPTMAQKEAQLIKETLTSSDVEHHPRVTRQTMNKTKKGS
jgi:uncharacterized membrane protein YqjE